MSLEDGAGPLLKGLSFWEHLSGEEKEDLCAHARTVRFSKGAGFDGGSDECAGLLLLQSGELRVYMLSEDGREITLYRLFPGEVCVLSASCILKEITFEVLMSAEEETTALLVPSSVFQRVSEKNIHAECFGYKIAAARFSDVMWAMQQILFMSVDRRLAIFLLDELSKENAHPLKLTHGQIARYMGSAREVVSRMLKYFEREGIVKLSRGGIQVTDLKRLRALAR